MLVIKAGNHKQLFSIANREDPDQTASSDQSDLGLLCLSMPFGYTFSGQNFRQSSPMLSQTAFYIPEKRGMLNKP